MELDRIASERVLRSIRNVVPDHWAAKVEELRRLAAGGTQVELAAYLDATGLALGDIYASGHSWSDMLAAAGLPVLESGPAEGELRKACGRLLHIDDAPRIEAYSRILSNLTPPTEEGTSVVDQRYIRMLVASVIGRAVAPTASLREAYELMWQHP
jgi:hypothetical protein